MPFLVAGKWDMRFMVVKERAANRIPVRDENATGSIIHRVRLQSQDGISDMDLLCLV